LSAPDGVEAVDLGLPSGLKWASCNVGATKPEEYGDYFAWGETETKESYYWDSYKWVNEGQSNWSQINKYTFADNQTDGCWYSGGEFVGDGRKKLSGADDAATANWGSKWQMPTREQFEELINSAYTTSEYTTQNGVSGLKVTGSNGNSIFLPAVGFRFATDAYLPGSAGYYWSRSVGPSNSDYASLLFFNSSAKVMDSNTRIIGCCIRPVRKSYEYVDLGLPSGTLWATCNIGADSPEEYGDYFAWGETETKEIYTWETYKWCNGTKESITKYNADGPDELLPEDDAATAIWGDNWQMPSEEQIEELRDYDNTTQEWTTENGINGWKITSKTNGNSIFLPAAGYIWQDQCRQLGTNGEYASRSLNKSDITKVVSIGFSKNFIGGWPNDREEGFTVRPVRKK
jgi:hypothetical protein